MKRKTLRAALLLLLAMSALLLWNKPEARQVISDPAPAYKGQQRQRLGSADQTDGAGCAAAPVQRLRQL